MSNEYLIPFGFIPGHENVICESCGKLWALMDPAATRCKRCARADLAAAAAQLDKEIAEEIKRKALSDINVSQIK